MNFRLVKERALRALMLGIRGLGLVMIVTGGWIMVNVEQAGAAVPVSSITGCDTAVAAMNAGLTTVSRSRIALKAATKSKNKRAIARAKQRLAAAESQRDLVRGKIKSLCNAGGVTAQAGGCSAAIEKLAASVESLAKNRGLLGSVKPAAKAKKAKLLALVHKLSKTVDAQTEAMRAACVPPAPPTQPTSPTGTAVTPPADKTAPTIAVDVKSPTNQVQPHVVLTPSESGVAIACTLDGNGLSVNALAFNLPLLSEGSHSLSCGGTDAAGNIGTPTVKTIVVDVTPPEAPLINGPSSTSTTLLAHGIAIQHLSEINPTAECKVDGGAYGLAPDLSFTHTYAVGLHTLTCRLIDAAGNVGPSSDYLVTILP